MNSYSFVKAGVGTIAERCIPRMLTAAEVGTLRLVRREQFRQILAKQV